MAFFFSFFSFEKYRERGEKYCISKAISMIRFTTKHHQQGSTYQTPHVFVLNKGRNTGKPLENPCPNCFVVQCNNNKDLENIKHIVHALWQLKFWHQHLIGSVIPYIRINDFHQNLTKKVSEMMHEHEQHIKYMAALKVLTEKEKQFHENLHLISEMRKVILYRYILKL